LATDLCKIPRYQIELKIRPVGAEFCCSDRRANKGTDVHDEANRRFPKLLSSVQTVYFSVLYVSQNKQRLFPYTALTDWFLKPRRSVFAVRYGLDI